MKFKMMILKHKTDPFEELFELWFKIGNYFRCLDKYYKIVKISNEKYEISFMEQTVTGNKIKTLSDSLRITSLKTSIKNKMYEMMTEDFVPQKAKVK